MDNAPIKSQMLSYRTKSIWASFKTYLKYKDTETLQVKIFRKIFFVITN